MNEATMIFMLDVLFIFTDVMNDGNPEDKSPGNAPNLE